MLRHNSLLVVNISIRTLELVQAFKVLYPKEGKERHPRRQHTKRTKPTIKQFISFSESMRTSVEQTSMEA